MVAQRQANDLISLALLALDYMQTYAFTVAILILIVTGMIGYCSLHWLCWGIALGLGS